MDNSIIHVIYVVASVLSIILFVLSVQFKNKKDILIVQTLSSICYMICYIILGAVTGFCSELVEQTKNLVFIGYEKKHKDIPLVVLLFFIGLLFVITIWKFDGWNSVIPLIIYILYFLSSYLKNPKHIRITMIICAVIWMVYNYSIGAYIIIFGNCLEIISATVALIRYDSDSSKKKGKKKTSKKSTKRKNKKVTK